MMQSRSSAGIRIRHAGMKENRKNLVSHNEEHHFEVMNFLITDKTNIINLICFRRTKYKINRCCEKKSNRNTIRNFGMVSCLHSSMFMLNNYHA